MRKFTLLTPVMVLIFVIAYRSSDGAASVRALNTPVATTSAMFDATGVASTGTAWRYSVVPILLKPDEGYEHHPHVGLSSMTVLTGTVCLGQKTLGSGAVVTIYQDHDPAAEATRSDCAEVVHQCSSTGQPCQEKTDCSGTCPLGASEWIQLWSGDTVVQTGDTDHSYYNPDASSDAKLINVVYVTATGTPSSGCTGDCY